MGFIIGAAIIVVICVIGLQGISLHQAQQANGDLERQLKRRDRDLAELRHKNAALREELHMLPLTYIKPPAVHVTRRREDGVQPGRPLSWDDAWPEDGMGI